MRAIRCCLLLGVLLILLMAHSEALQCYTCMGSTDEDCNRQGSKTCPSYSDACAIVRGHSSGVMKSCSYKSFCSQANSQGYRAPGVKVHCCFSDDCNAAGHASQISGGVVVLLVLLPLCLQIFY
ncbi:lymphocyte antigen 6 family member pge [Denticeps clupeoides]|uniref:lymphocyte antigen 6 family member pge n=1 Tax=Denticeps clupeoides TaxID=299321 RepID=UPI0010A356A7|nr:prostate stem cell antigen [Denticeps clupeoides]XP_028844438.1 prostate stem cell antigen [Denticeps clupeoides]